MSVALVEDSSPLLAAVFAPVSDEFFFAARGQGATLNETPIFATDGTELDFAREGLNEGFKFNNPNVQDSCGCGESFNV